MNALLSRALLTASLCFILLCGMVAYVHASLLVVDLKTNWIPGEEFTAVRTTILDGPKIPQAQTKAVFAGDPVEDPGIRLAEFDNIDNGNYTVETQLLTRDGSVLDTRRVIASVDGAFGFIMLFARPEEPENQLVTTPQLTPGLVQQQANPKIRAELMDKVRNIELDVARNDAIAPLPSDVASLPRTPSEPIEDTDPLGTTGREEPNSDDLTIVAQTKSETPPSSDDKVNSGSSLDSEETELIVSNAQGLNGIGGSGCSLRATKGAIELWSLLVLSAPALMKLRSR